MKQWLKDFTHNCIVHPLMMVLPRNLAHTLHDRNADWAWGEQGHYDELTLEGAKTYKELLTENQKLKENLEIKDAHIQQLYADLNTPEGED